MIYLKSDWIDMWWLMYATLFSKDKEKQYNPAILERIVHSVFECIETRKEHIKKA